MKSFKEIIVGNQKMALTFPFDLIPMVLISLMMFCFSCKKNTENIQLEREMVISESVTVAKDTFYINSSLDYSAPAITIKGNDISVDFQGAVLKGSNDVYYPNEIYGIGLTVSGQNIKIKNLTIHGYQIGLLSIGVDGLEIFDSEFSYNSKCSSSLDEDGEYSCLLPAQGKNITPELWAAVKLDSCKNLLFKNNTVSQNQTGLFVSNCKNGKIYNNQITYNSHTGILVEESTELSIMHNFLDWNREFGVRCSSQSKNSVIAYNSITHVPFNEPGGNIGFKNNHFPFERPNSPDSLSQKYPPLSDGQNTDEFPSTFKGEKYFLFNEWGTYNFQYPAIWLREINDDNYTFTIFGPEGNWKIVDGNGFVQTSRQSGSMPATIVATKSKNSAEPLSLDLEFIGVEFIDQFGRRNPRGKTFKFNFKT